MPCHGVRRRARAEQFEAPGQRVGKSRIAQLVRLAVIDVAVSLGNIPPKSQIKRAIRLDLPMAVEGQEIAKDDQAEQRNAQPLGPMKDPSRPEGAGVEAVWIF